MTSYETKKEELNQESYKAYPRLPVLRGKITESKIAKGSYLITDYFIGPERIGAV